MDLRQIRVVNASAPIRICDIGGWTDTWFARWGRVLNLGVYPYAEVQIQVSPFRSAEQRIIIHAENYGERYAVSETSGQWSRHPLLEAAIERMQIPDDISIEVTIYSEAPAGASTGTSAAVAVALVGALDCLTPGRMTVEQIAATAHFIEVEMLHLQSGIQDQLCSALGGINYIEMDQYPQASVTQVIIPNPLWWELERRLLLIYLGKSHHSSDIHEKVVKELEREGPDCSRLNTLRKIAEDSRDALIAGDFTAFGRAMIKNTEAQASLHSELVGIDARTVIEIAKSQGASGWKVNGAGGDGGSITILCNEYSTQKRALIREIKQTNPLYSIIPIYLSRFGVRVWEEKKISNSFRQ